jgi:hypothetical protein
VNNLDLRPLGLGELLDRALTLYRRRFWVFVGIMAIPACTHIPMNFYALRSTGMPLPMRQSTPSAPPAIFSSVYFELVLVSWIVYSVALGATTYAVADAYLGKNPTIRSAYGKVWRQFWRLLGLILNVGIRVAGLFSLFVFVAGFAGGLLIAVIGRAGPAGAVIGASITVGLIVGGFSLATWFALRYAVTIPSMLLESITGRQSIRRSKDLTDGSRGRIFVAVLLTVLLSCIGVMIFEGPFIFASPVTGSSVHPPSWLLIATTVSGAVGGSISGALMMIVLVLCYYDLRIRKEAFDLEHMVASLDEKQPLGPPAAAAGQISP